MEVLLFTGHLIDSKNRSEPRLPLSKITYLQHLIREELDASIENPENFLGVCSLGAGADMFFAREMIRRDIPFHVFLPFSKADFIKISVSYEKNDDVVNTNIDWELEFEEILSKAKRVHFLSESGYVSPKQFQDCNDEMLSFSLEKTKNSTVKIVALASMDPESITLTGGTGDFLDKIRIKGIEVRRIWFDERKPFFLDTEINYSLMNEMVPLFKKMDQQANSSQHLWRRYFRFSLTLIAVIAFFSSFDQLRGSYIGNAGIYIRVGSIIITMCGALLELFFQFNDKNVERRWVTYRAIAENIRSEIWFFLMGYLPKNIKTIYTPSLWENYLKNFDSIVPVIEDDYQVNSLLAKKLESYRILFLQQKKEQYNNYRINDQLNYYKKKIFMLQRWLYLYKTSRIVLLFFSIIWGSFMIYNTFHPFAEIFNDLNLIGFAVTLIATFSAFTEAENLVELRDVYRKMSEGLSEFQLKLSEIRHDEEFRNFLYDVESFIRKQNDDWSFKKAVKIS